MDSIIKQKFIERILAQEGKNIIRAQNRVLARFNPQAKDLIIARRRFKVTGSSLEFTHLKQQRFIDMKRLRGQKRKPIPVHNKIIYGHFNNIINQLTSGYTEDVRQLIAQEHNIQL